MKAPGIPGPSGTANVSLGLIAWTADSIDENTLFILWLQSIPQPRDFVCEWSHAIVTRE